MDHAPALNRVLDALIPASDPDYVPTSDELYDAFTQWADSTGRPLYPHQEESLLAIVEGEHVVAATPTALRQRPRALASQ